MIAEYKCQHCGNEMAVYWVNTNPLGTVRCDNCGLFGQRERVARFGAWLAKVSRFLFRLLDYLFYKNGEQLPSPLAGLRSFAWGKICGPNPT